MNNKKIFIIKRGNQLTGEIKASGAKNAALPIMAANILATSPVIIRRVPNISDVRIMARILRALGAKVTFRKGIMKIDSSNMSSVRAPYKLVSKIHASFDITGPLLARFKYAEVPLPGGCNLGTRPVNFHIDGFKALGADVKFEHGYVIVSARKLKGANIFLPKPSVGATKNIMMAACLASGTTVIENAAREPEVADLANFLIQLGAHIKGHGTSKLEIEGVKSLDGGLDYTIISDRIEAGTYLLAGASTQGEITVNSINPEFLEAFLFKLKNAGQKIDMGEDWISVRGKRPLKAVDISTAPFPGFPTDLHPPIASFLCFADGTSVIEETIFDGRFIYLDELRRLGADVKIKNHSVLIKGVKKLSGAPVVAPDIRAGGALIIAGLSAEGETVISGLDKIDRGYEDIENKLRLLGADIRRENRDACRD
ncbi:MAG: UDP-N-acetylglucosamine 1-carboxyvinyltransferase [Candidatus Eremiobacteraeota bacterium]|nr:UDP-N-acetylglucosamine 1-carboxyvinyltransferase [Candidatus Eremiobacteraeota bacterium]